MNAEKKRGLRKAAIIVRVTAFLCIFTTLLVVVNQFIAGRVGQSHGWQMIHNGGSADQIDVVFMGNSYAYSSFNPYIINQALGLQSVVIASSASNITVINSQLKEILSYKKPKLIVLELNILVDNYNDLMIKKRGLVYAYLDSMHTGLNKVNLALQLLKPEHLPEALFPVFRSRHLSVALNTKPQAATKEEQLGFIRLTDAFIPENPVDQKTLHAWPVMPRQQEELRSFIRLCKDSGVDLWLVNKPRLEPRDLTVIRKIAAEYGIPVINMNEPPDKVNVSPSLFFDGGHLNALGANRVTEAMVARLEDYFHQTADYMKVLTMKNETVQAEGDGSYRFIVNAYAPDTMYSFEVYQDDMVIFIQQESGTNSILVKPTKKGTYKVKYNINFYNDGTLVSNFNSEFSIKLTPE